MVGIGTLLRHIRVTTRHIESPLSRRKAHQQWQYKFIYLQKSYNLTIRRREGRPIFDAVAGFVVARST